MTASAHAPAGRIWQAGTPGLFVFLWSTGFIFAKLGLPYAEPFTFLAWRFAIVAALMFAVAFASRAPWPRGLSMYGHIAVVGVLMHGAYLGGTFAAIGAGVSAGVAALIVGLQPLLTATVVGPLLGERVGLSTTPCTERVRRLERDGVITGYYARLDPQYLKANLLVFVEISLAYKSGDIFEEFRRAALKLPNVLECHLMSGDFDYLIKARISEMASYRKLLGSSLLTLPHVRESKSYIVMEEVKETLALAIPVVPRGVSMP